MVQRKSATRLRPQPQPKPKRASGTKPESPPQESKNTAVDLKLMLKKARSIKLLEGDLLQENTKKKLPASRSPNYMKPTSSSHARKDRPADKKASETTDNSSDGSVVKSSKTLMKRLSLKLMHPWVKKLPAVELNDNVEGNVSRATCSSTLKASTFPKTLELNPGASEAAGTSAMRVCPYTYCSLNGHRHEPLPPLSRVISVRRRMLKSQKSMRLKGLSSFKVKGLRKSNNQEVDTREVIITRVPSLKAPLIEEVVVDDDNFFVEIYAKPQAQILKSLERLLLIEGSGYHGSDQMSESSSEISFGELSVEEMDVVKDFLEYIEQDQQEGSDEDADPIFDAEWGFSCGAVDELIKEGECVAESVANASAFESIDLDWEEEDSAADLCRYLDLSLANESASDQPPSAPQDALVSAGADEGQICDFVSHTEEYRSKIDLTSAVDDETSKLLVALGSSVPVQDDVVDEKLSCISILNVEEERSKIDVPLVIKDDLLLDNLVKQETDQCDVNHERDDGTSDTEGGEAEFEEKEALFASGESLNGNEQVDNGMEEFVEDDDGNSMMKIQFSNSPQGFYEIDLELAEDGDEIIEPSEQSVTESGSNPKARYSYVRRRTTEDVHEMKGFDPQAPRFLPEVSDPEAEKVDLRHQEMDDRKNAEDWMVDYALQRTVSRLARARSRKVRLFVEAFETVLQPPVRETSQQHAAMDLDQARRLQYCR